MRVAHVIATAIVVRPWASLVALGALVAWSLLGLAGEPPRDSFGAGPEWRAAEAARSVFDLDDHAAFLAIFGPVFEAGRGDGVRQLEQRLEALPWVGEVGTPFDVPGIETLQEAAANPLLRGTLVDADGKGLMLPVSFDKDAEGRIPAGWVDVLRESARSVLEASAGAAPPLEVGVTGKWPLVRAQRSALERERWRFQLTGAIFGFLIAALSFRNVRATLIAGLPPILGVFVAVGVARGFGLGGSGFTTIVLPLLVLTIGFTDSLHLVVAAARARRTGAPDGAVAAEVAVDELVGPCALTSLTTAIGFASLATTGNPLVSEFGLSCALATALTFLCVILSIPLLCRTPLGATLDRVRPPSFEGTDDEGVARTGDAPFHRTGLVARIVESGLCLALRAPRRVAAFAVGLTLASGWIASGLQADRRVASDLADGSLAASTLARVDAELGGALLLHVRMDWDEGVDGDELLAVARRARAELVAHPQLTGAVGPAEVIDQVLRGPWAAASPGPVAPSEWDLLRLVPDRWRVPFVDLDRRSALLHTRIPDAGSRVLTGVFASIEEGLRAIEVPGVRLSLVGEHLAYLQTVDRVTRDLAWSLALAALLILLTLGLAFRSWRLGLVSVVPNLLPLGASAAGLALLGGDVDVSTLTALTLSLGIATDDTIHVLARWRRGRNRGLPPERAARSAVLQTYPALAVTTMTLTVAFAQLLTSSLPTIRDFGLLAATTLGVAFLADVWLLPAIAVALWPRPEVSLPPSE